MRFSLCPTFLSSVLACAVCVGSALALAVPVHAQETLDDDRAHAHFVAGESHFAAERWADASREFALAYEMSRRPEMLINLSRAHERDVQLAAAIADLELLLEVHPESAYRGEAEQRMAAMRERLARQPAPLVTAPAADLPAVSDPASSQPAAAPPSKWPSWPTLAVGGVGIVAGVVALGTGLSAHGKYGDLEDRCDADSRCDPSFASDRDRGRALARSSTALTFVSVALVGTAAVLWVYDIKRRNERQALAFGVDGAGARLRAEF